MLNFDEWMKNDVNMTLWLQSQGNCVTIEKELL